MYTYIYKITNKNLLYSTEKSTSYSVKAYREKELKTNSGYNLICFTAPETQHYKSTILQFNNNNKKNRAFELGSQESSCSAHQSVLDSHHTLPRNCSIHIASSSSPKYILESIATLPCPSYSYLGSDSPSKVQVKVGPLFLDINKVISPSSEILQ